MQKLSTYYKLKTNFPTDKDYLSCSTTLLIKVYKLNIGFLHFLFRMSIRSFVHLFYKRRYLNLWLVYLEQSHIVLDSLVLSLLQLPPYSWLYFWYVVFRIKFRPEIWRRRFQRLKNEAVQLCLFPPRKVIVQVFVSSNVYWVFYNFIRLQAILL